MRLLWTSGVRSIWITANHISRSKRSGDLKSLPNVLKSKVCIQCCCEILLTLMKKKSIYDIFQCDETTCSAMKVKMSRILFTCCRKQEKILFTKTRMHKYKVERIQIDISHWLFTGGKYCVQLFMHSFCAMLYSLVFQFLR